MEVLLAIFIVLAVFAIYFLLVVAFWCLGGWLCEKMGVFFDDFE